MSAASQRTATPPRHQCAFLLEFPEFMKMLRHDDRPEEWYILDAECGPVVVDFCPHCGERLP